MAEVVEDFTLLVGRVRLGDVGALAELTRRYEPDFRLAARVLLGRALRSHLDSADLVQSVHHTLLLGLRQNKFELSSPQHLVGLAVTLVRRKVARHWRRLQRQQTFDPQEGETRGPLDLLTCLSNSERDPAEEAQYRDAIEHVCSHLEEKDRHLVQLRLQGFSTAEAARQLGEDADVLRVRLSRLRRRLRDSRVLREWL
jgi:RNA polymerase sigma factor (sigma-70 family)